VDSAGLCGLNNKKSRMKELILDYRKNEISAHPNIKEYDSILKGIQRS